MSIFGVAIDAAAGPAFVVDVETMRENLARIRAAAGDTPVRIATKSIRVRSVIEWALAQDGVIGALTYSAAESLWLVQNGARDVVIGYPSVDVETMRAVAADPVAREEIAFMADLPAHLELLDAVGRRFGVRLRVCLDVDASLRIGRVHLGTHRSSIHTPQEAAALAELAAGMAGVRVVGIMMYEAQVAGVADVTPVHAMMKRRSVAELAVRRSQIRDAVSRHADLEFVNGGGTGSVHLTSSDPSVTDVAAGSALFSSTHYDHYRALTTQPAAFFVTTVVRKPKPGIAVTFSGGFLASGPGAASRMPTPVWPEKLRYYGQEGAGEVQTPLHGRGARGLQVGDSVWFRHTKAGEVCERFDTAHLVEHGAVVDEVPTYRGEGKNFG